MTKLVILAAVIAFATAPHKGYDSDYDAEGRHSHVVRHPPRYHVVGWALVCIAMIAGLVTWGTRS